MLQLMKWKSAVLTAVTVVALSGCATTPTSNPSPVTPDRILSSSLLSASSERNQPVTVIRDSGFLGSAVQMVFKVDDMPVASLKAGERIDLYLAPGKYVFVAEGKPNPLGEPPGESEVEIRSGKPNKFRLRLVPGDGPRYERTIQ